ncbi:MAG: histidinol-phosphate aminotransferase family protein [Deltaproteobacteria bacterium]|nr:histidinol-phosphate aminotransferase family protein [Deltaproteobacteria bacterium]
MTGIFEDGTKSQEASNPGSPASPQPPSPANLVRPELRRLKAYHLVQGPSRFKLDQNEVAWDLPLRIKKRCVDRLMQESWATYPTFNADEFRKALGEHYDWPWEGVLAGAGSSELLSICVESMCPPMGEVISHTPSFGLYSMLVPRSGGTPRFLQAGSDLALPMEALMAEVEKDPRRPVILCSPNNPVGDAATVEQVEALLQRLEGPLLLDNAYHEFSRYDYRPLLDRYRHLVLLRTLSKAWSVAGLRLGYMLADPELVAELVKAKLPYNLGHPSVAAGLAVLSEPAVSERAVGTILRRRPQWEELLQQAGFETFPTETNFVLLRCGTDDGAQGRSEVLRQGLSDRGILVRDVSAGPGLRGCLRVTVGGGGALRAFRRALDEMGYLAGGRV